VVFRLTAESEELVLSRVDMLRELQAHKKYHQYMSRVLEAAGDFHEISEIMSRYQTLLATYEVCQSGYYSTDVFPPGNLPMFTTN